MRSLTIVVAMLSLAAGAWQGTTAQSERPGSRTTTTPKGENGSAPLTLRGCVQKEQADGTFLLVTPGPATETRLEPATRPQDSSGPPDNSTPGTPSSATAPIEAAPHTVTYELVAGKPEMDLAVLVGQRVELQGTAERTARGATADDSPTEAEAAADTPAGSPAAVGTTGASSRGAASVSQRSRVRVSAVRPTGGPCT